MNKNNVKFTPEAAERWNRISKESQELYLNKAWCTQCRVAVSMILESGEMGGEDRFLLLKGKCQNCGHVVNRVIEPDEE